MSVCRHCGFENIVERQTCEQCGESVQDEVIAGRSLTGTPATSERKARAARGSPKRSTIGAVAVLVVLAARLVMAGIEDLATAASSPKPAGAGQSNGRTSAEVAPVSRSVKDSWPWYSIAPQVKRASGPSSFDLDEAHPDYRRVVNYVRGFDLCANRPESDLFARYTIGGSIVSQGYSVEALGKVFRLHGTRVIAATNAYIVWFVTSEGVERYDYTYYVWPDIGLVNPLNSNAQDLAAYVTMYVCPSLRG